MATKTIKLNAGAKDANKEVQFIRINLCSDVFIQVIHNGTRHQLAKLERVGRRLLWLINKCFAESPFLILKLKFL